MVQDQKQNVVVGTEPQETRPEQRRTRHIEWCPGLLLGSQLRLLEQQRLGAVVFGRRPGCKIFNDEA